MPALVARSDNAALNSDRSETFWDSKLGLIKESGKVSVAARFNVDAPLRPFSSWTIDARPRSNPSAFGGYHGLISFESTVGTVRFQNSDCGMQIGLRLFKSELSTLSLACQKISSPQSAIRNLVHHSA